MNLYLVLAIALGAISTAVDLPALRPVQLVAQRQSRRQQRQVRVAPAVRMRKASRLWSCRPQRVSNAPRPYGTGSPRAPALA